MISLTSPVKTRAHRWPAAVKMAGLCAATLLLFSQSTLTFHVVTFVGMLVIYGLPGAVFMISGLRLLWRLWPFVVLLLLWGILTDDATETAMISLRMITAVGLANLVTMTTRLTDMMTLIAKILSPLAAIGLRPRAIELAIALAIRFTPELIRHGTGLRQAWRARSPKRAGWRIILPMAVLALDEADHVAEALRARGGASGP